MKIAKNRFFGKTPFLSFWGVTFCDPSTDLEVKANFVENFVGFPAI